MEYSNRKKGTYGQLYQYCISNGKKALHAETSNAKFIPPHDKVYTKSQNITDYLPPVENEEMSYMYGSTPPEQIQAYRYDVFSPDRGDVKYQPNDATNFYPIITKDVNINFAKNQQK